jgi:hypothetical protein
VHDDGETWFMITNGCEGESDGGYGFSSMWRGSKKGVKCCRGW